MRQEAERAGSSKNVCRAACGLQGTPRFWTKLNEDHKGYQDILDITIFDSRAQNPQSLCSFPTMTMHFHVHSMQTRHKMWSAKRSKKKNWTCVCGRLLRINCHTCTCTVSFKLSKWHAWDMMSYWLSAWYDKDRSQRSNKPFGPRQWLRNLPFGGRLRNSAGTPADLEAPFAFYPSLKKNTTLVSCASISSWYQAEATQIGNKTWQNIACAVVCNAAMQSMHFSCYFSRNSQHPAPLRHHLLANWGREVSRSCLAQLVSQQTGWSCSCKQQMQPLVGPPFNLNRKAGASFCHDLQLGATVVKQPYPVININSKSKQHFLKCQNLRGELRNTILQLFLGIFRICWATPQFEETACFLCEENLFSKDTQAQLQAHMSAQTLKGSESERTKDTQASTRKNSAQLS